MKHYTAQRTVKVETDKQTSRNLYADTYIERER